MKTNMFIPKKINVGFQERGGTYTGKLAYIIYFDEKGVLRKEKSWDSWRKKEIPNEIHENVPTEGFVLNKKVGDYVSHWNHRQAYVRVYDPRGFEFEITIENLLYILENANSIKGKGLEGEFIYSWDGKDLVLLPVNSADYKAIDEYNKKMHSRVKLKGKDLKVGATYLTKDNEEFVYLGRFDLWEIDYDSMTTNKLGEDVRDTKIKGKRYFFYTTSHYRRIVRVSSLANKIISVVDENCHEDFASMFDMLEKNSSYSPVDHSKDEIVPYTFEEFKEKCEKKSWGVNFYSSEMKKVELEKDSYTDSTEKLYERVRVPYTRNAWGGRSYETWTTEKQSLGNLEEVFNKFKPIYLRKYLKNGKLYSEGK